MPIAYAGIPMIALHLPAMVLLFAPIALVEWWVARRVLGGPERRLMGGVVRANLATTLLGVPLTWIASLAVNVALEGSVPRDVETLPGLVATLLLRASWFDTPTPEMEWMVPAATLVLLVPYFFVSVLGERVVLRRAWPDVAPADVRRVAWRANLASYGLLAAPTTVWLLVLAG